MHGDHRGERSYNHVAFKITDDRFDACRDAVESLGLDVLPPRPRIEGEARSLYFFDDDNHLFELHAGTLNERLDAYRRAALKR